MKQLLRFWLFLPLLFIAVSASAQVTADFSASPLEGCAPLTVYFSDASTGTITTYNWNLGNGVTPGSQNPSTTYINPGTYNITLTVTGPGGTDTKTKNAYVTVYKKPSVNFTSNQSPSTGCLPLQVTFTPSVSLNNQPGPAAYTWDFGDGSPTSNASNPTHTYTTVGPFSVTLTVGGQYCDSSITKAFFVNTYAKPSAQFVSDSDYICSTSGAIKFTNTSNGGPFSNVFWRFGDGSTGTGSPTTHLYAGGGPNYDVTVIVTDAHGCMDSVKSFAYIRKYPFTPSFASANAVCRGTAISFFNTTPGAVIATSWAYGDGFSDAGTSPSHIYDTFGTFPVVMSTTIGPCTKYVTNNVVVHPLPNTSINFLPAIPCPAPVGVTFIATNTNIAHPFFNWDFGNGDTALHRNPAVDTFRTNGYKTVQVTTIDSATGCSSVTVKDSVPIRNIIRAFPAFPIPGASPLEGCYPLVSTFSASIYSSLPPPLLPTDPPPPYPVPIATYNWTFIGGSPATSMSPTPTDTFAAIGTYKIILNAVTANGCPFKDSTTVHADGPVGPSFYALPDSVCPRVPITFYNTSPVVAGTTYTWNLGDTSIVYTNVNFKPTVTRAYRVSGPYTIALSTNHNGCDSIVSKTALVYVRPASANFLYTIQCPPKTAPFVYKVDFSDASVQATSWEWDFGDGSPHSFAQNPPTHSYASTGIYQVKLMVYNSAYGCHDTIVRPVAPYKAKITFSADDSAICLGDELVFTGAVNSLAAASYSWIFDNNPATQTPYTADFSIAYTFPTAGFHTVTLVTKSGNNNSCLDTLTAPNIVLVSHPVAKFGAFPAPIGCTPFFVTLRDSTVITPGVKITTRVWDFGDGSTPPGNVVNPTHTYQTGVYSPYLKVTDSLGCYDTLTRLSYIQARKPVALFNIAKTPAVFCARDTLPIINSSVGATLLTYLWTFGDGTTSTAVQPRKAYTKAGTYSIRLIVFDATGCSDTALLSNFVTINSPKASFTMDKTISPCGRALTILFTSTSTGAVYNKWFFEASSPIITRDTATHTFANPGIYNIVLTAVDATGCTDTAMRQAYVLGYAGAFTISPTDVCVGRAVTFSSSITNVPKISWDFNDGSGDTSNSPVITHIYTVPKTYYPSVIFSDGTPTCKIASATTTPVRVDKVSAAFSATVPCVDSPFILTSSSSAVFSQPNYWRWFFPAADTATGPVTRHIFGTAGAYAVTIIAANAWGCADTLTKNVFINPLPIIDAGPADTGICPGDTIRLVGRGGLSYIWSSPTAPVVCATCDTALVFTAAPTEYFVIGTDANGCHNRDSITARIQIQTTSSVSKGGDICIGESFRLYAAGATSYSWQPVRFLDSPNIAAPLATPITTTAYVVKAQEGTCLERYDTVIVAVHPTPVFFTAGPDAVINYGTSIILQPGTSGIDSIRWRPDSSLSCLNCFRPVAKPYITTRYFAVGYTEWGCADSAEVLIRVRCNGDSVFIPNTFTPNGDGYNDVFYPRGKGISGMRAMRIFNRWGELVFERTNFPLNDATLGWDGTFKGHALPPDVYVYVMDSRCEDGGELIQWKGDITLMR